jgi:integrase
MEHRKAIGTLYNYDSLWKKLAPIADRDISCLDVIECQSLIDNEPSPSAKAKIKMLIGNLIEFCPTLNITPRQVHQALYAPGTQSKRKKVFTEQEIHRLWDLDSDRYCRALLILLYSGMRIGELHQAEPDAVNMAERYLVGGEKTSAGKNRVIPIRKEIAPLIRDHFAHPRQSLSALRKGVSTFLTGAAMEHTSHEARHTFISRAIQSQVPLPIVQQIVGHSAGNVTLSVYTHLPPAELVRAVDSIHMC